MCRYTHRATRAARERGCEAPACASTAVSNRRAAKVVLTILRRIALLVPLSERGKAAPTAGRFYSKSPAGERVVGTTSLARRSPYRQFAFGPVNCKLDIQSTIAVVRRAAMSRRDLKRLNHFVQERSVQFCSRNGFWTGDVVTLGSDLRDLLREVRDRGTPPRYSAGYPVRVRSTQPIRLALAADPISPEFQTIIEQTRSMVWPIHVIRSSRS